MCSSDLQIRAAETKKRRVVISVILGVVALLSIVAFALGRTGVWEALIGILPLAVYEPSVFVASRMQAQTKARHARERSIAARQARQVNVVRPPEKSSTVHVFVPGSDSEWERALDRSA